MRDLHRGTKKVLIQKNILYSERSEEAIDFTQMFVFFLFLCVPRKAPRESLRSLRVDPLSGSPN